MNSTRSEKEITFDVNELIVSKTDLKGKITYANRVFMKVSNYSEPELLGVNHNLIRHPDMPRGVFFAIWKTLQAGREFFGFVKNATADGNYYWVFANITPDVQDGNIVGYYSVRRCAPAVAIKTIEPVYREMLRIESTTNKANAPKSSWQWLEEKIQNEHGISYEEFIIQLYLNNQK